MRVYIFEGSMVEWHCALCARNGVEGVGCGVCEG